MRGLVPGMDSPYPLGEMLPGVLQEDAVAMQLTAALDTVLAPVIGTLDCLDGYFDPRLAPEDFLSWLAGWVGADLDENWPADRHRSVVARAVELYRMRGTVAGLRAHLEVVTGGRVQITDNGGVSWSTTPNGRLPGEDTPRLAVRVIVDEPEVVKSASVEAIVAAAKPAHVAHRVEVVAP